ncbi:MAG: sigma-54-dependent Fis family transcriptional regulator [Deltaproteobacteria bacterium]|nr:sigma-54-dependent Fis family transcriptional regulator [Deltaproteobacteria bacterium]
MSGLKALIADDDSSILWVLERFLEEKKIGVVKAENGPEASALLSTPGIALAILDINMPGKDGLEVLREAKEAGSRSEFIIMTAESTMKNTLEAMKFGAFDYITKPFDLGELEIMVDRAIETMGLKARLVNLTERLKERLAHETVFIGKSKAVQNVFKTVGKVAGKDVTVLVLGESGTGKELLARLIHSNGPRSVGPFVAVNSAAVPRDLMESELFGFEKGAFTGAVEEKKGKFELADGGTLFLDEVGDMPIDLQARLLRVLQEKEFYKVGGKAPVKVDVRIIAATNQDIDKAVAEKRFREDLLFRLNGVTVTLPALRERKNDVELLADYFLEKFSDEFGGGKKTLSPKAMDALESYPWPGNVRELGNVLRRAVLLSPGLAISPEDLNLPQARHRKESIEEIITARLRPFIDKTDHKGKQELYDFIMPFMERPLIKLVLEKTKGNQVQAAEVLGINRNTLRKKIKDLNIKLGKLRE